MIDSDVLWLLAIVLYVPFIIFQVKKGHFKETLFYRSLFYFYITSVLAATFFPIPFQETLIYDRSQEGHFRYNIIPFASIDEILKGPSYVYWKQLGGNILLFLPLGFFAPLVFKPRSFQKTLLIGLLASIAIELTQLILSASFGYTYRIVDIDDVILNTLGFVLGYGMFKLIRPANTGKEKISW